MTDFDFDFDFHYMLHGTGQETPCSCARGTVWHALLFFVVVCIYVVGGRLGHFHIKI